MGALKPWHVLVATVCCILPLVLAVAGGVWAVRKRRQPGQG